MPIVITSAFDEGRRKIKRLGRDPAPTPHAAIFRAAIVVARGDSQRRIAMGMRLGDQRGQLSGRAADVAQAL